MKRLAQLMTIQESNFLLNKHVNLAATITTMLAVAWLTYSVDLNDPVTFERWASSDKHLLLIIAASFLLMFLCALTPLPAEAVTLANGVIFGPAVGTMVTWLSAMLGAYVTFLWSRRLLGANIKLFDEAKYKKVNGWVSKWGVFGFLLARLLPVVPFFALNIGAALLPVSRRNFLLITGIAILPHILMICYLGHFFLGPGSNGT